ncbi:MAG: L-threonylcarbamoyladenylate synthase [Propionibacteriaceae bacterium]
MAMQVFSTTTMTCGLAAAEAAVTAGGPIVLPTDTVYGIGADPYSAQAVERLFTAKKRPHDKPIPVLAADVDVLDDLGTEVPTAARDLAAAFWPGALTLIVRRNPDTVMHLGDSDGTIALRVPDHDIARSVLRRTGPLAVTSANVSGKPSSTSCAEALSQLGDGAVVYLDAGETPGEIPSTIIDFASTVSGRIVREGILSAQQLRTVAADLQS